MTTILKAGVASMGGPSLFSDLALVTAALIRVLIQQKML